MLWIFQEVLCNFAICLMCSGWLVFIDFEYQVSLRLTYIFSSTWACKQFRIYVWVSYLRVVYQLTCSCGRKYVGQSKRNLIFKINEHQPSATHQTDSKVTQHLLENPQHIMEKTSHQWNIIYSKSLTYPLIMMNDPIHCIFSACSVKYCFFSSVTRPNICLAV